MTRHKATRGHTALEILIAVGVATIVAVVLAQLSQDILKNILRNQLVATRDQLAISIRQSAASIKGLQNSLKQPMNTQFYNCVCGQGSGCASAQVYPLRLFDTTASITPVDRYFNASGLPCIATAKNCLIEVEVSFIAQCLPVMPSPDPSPPATCIGVPAEFVGIAYEVRQNPLTVDQGILIKPIGSTVFTLISSINPLGSGMCP